MNRLYLFVILVSLLHTKAYAVSLRQSIGRRLLDMAGGDSSTTKFRLFKPQPAAWIPIWQDNFDKFNPDNWEIQRYDGCQYEICGWGNNEKSYYTNRTKNVNVVNGRLRLTATKETTAEGFDYLLNDCYSECVDRCMAEGWKGVALDFCISGCGDQRCPIVQNNGISSGRIRSYQKFSIVPNDTYPTIRIEARIRLPPGEGLWPAFWMLSEDNTYGTWPASGEIDIMESINDMETIFGTIHFGAPWPGNVEKGNVVSRVADPALGSAPSFQIYAIEWSKTEMNWYIDDRLYSTQKSGAWWTTGSTDPGAPFDKPFHLIFNLAVGGNLAGNHTVETLQNTLATDKVLEVDYVKVMGR